MKHKYLLTAILTIGTCLVLSTTAGAHPASGIVIDRGGNVYFSDLETIWKINTNGKLSVFRAGVRGRHIHELAIDEHDNIYGGDVSYDSQKWISEVWKMTPDGRFEYLLAPTDSPPPGMSIWRDHAGNNYFVDQNNHTKTQTLLLRRTPAGVVTTLAGSAYGHMDGNGTAAKFGSIGGLAFGPDGSLYLTDGAFVRKVGMDGTVTTVAQGLDVRTSEDKPTLFGGLSGSLTGIAVDAAENIYVTDQGNRRLFKINRAGLAEVLFRTDPPYFPNGVAVAPDGTVYVLEFSLTLLGSGSGPRVRKISPNGQSEILATVGADRDGANLKATVVRAAGASTERFLSFIVAERSRYGLLILAVAIFGAGGLLWQRWRKRRV
jgi:sugar lactone lactonase YvrE